MCAELIPLSVLALNVDEPPGGWPGVVEDDVGLPSVPREVARSLLAEHRSQQEAVARKRAALERQAVEQDRRFRASLPAGIPAGAVPEGISAGMLMMLSDEEAQSARRESPLEHALRNSGSAVFHPIREER